MRVKFKILFIRMNRQSVQGRRIIVETGCKTINHNKNQKEV